ncbi:Pyoverdine/dityrosine biosynthesis domain-containing protein [Trichoderma sp. SZMC 28013]
MPDTDITSRILTIIQGYGHNEENAEGEQWLGRAKFVPRVQKYVDSNAPIDLILPGFPWKSVNKEEKVLGALPDLGEELALGRLQNICKDIQEVYAPGAYVTIISDGLVYSDLMGISIEEIFEYGSGVRRMAEAKSYNRLRFKRIMNLVGISDSIQVTKEEYISSVDESRRLLVEKYMPKEFNAREAIANDPDINLTYSGYIKLLNRDLRYSLVTANDTTEEEYKQTVERVASNLITRGKAYAAIIDDNFPEHIRLSIHRSTGNNKLSFPLIPQPDGSSMTPWHCSVAVTSKGEFRTALAADLHESFDVIEQDGRPYYFRDRSDVWKWDVPVEFEVFYPRGLYIRARAIEGEAAPKIGPNELAKIEQLRKAFSPVTLVGFA